MLKKTSRGLEIFMAYKKDLGEVFFVKNLLEVVKTRELTQEETDKLVSLFVEAYGRLPSNLCLHPKWLLNKWETVENEDKAIETWYAKDNIAFIDNTPIELKNKDISFMCEKPQLCRSHQTNGFACKCIRTNFTPTEFKLWAKNELTELKGELKELLPQEE